MINIRPFKLERFFAQYEFNTEYLLCSSDCESLSIQELLDLEPDGKDKFHQHRLGYTETRGSPSLRKEISRIYQSISPDQVLVHSGAQEGIFTFMQSVLNSGDHIIVHWPCYQSLFEIAASLGCQVSRWEAREENAWKLDLEELKKLLQPNTRAIILNTPHNPTGYLMSASSYRTLWDIVESAGILLFSDEVYRESEYDPQDRLPPACDVGEQGISLGVMSKSYGLAGLRIGWIATRNQNLYQRIARMKDYTTICSSAPSEFLAELALRHRGQLLNRNLKIITKNLEILEDFFQRYPDLFRWHPPDAGPIAFPRLLKGRVAEFCDRLVKEAGVLLLPGDVFDHPGNHFRIGFGRANLPQAIQRLESYLSP